MISDQEPTLRYFQFQCDNNYQVLKVFLRKNSYQE